MRTFLLSGLCAIVLVACASANGGAAAGGPSSRDIVFKGSFEALDQLAQAGRACGYTDLRVDAFGGGHLTPALVIPDRHDGRFQCLRQWVREHRELGFRL